MAKLGHQLRCSCSDWSSTWTAGSLIWLIFFGRKAERSASWCEDENDWQVKWQAPFRTLLRFLKPSLKQTSLATAARNLCKSRGSALRIVTKARPTTACVARQRTVSAEYFRDCLCSFTYIDREIVLFRLARQKLFRKCLCDLYPPLQGLTVGATLSLGTWRLAGDGRRLHYDT